MAHEGRESTREDFDPDIAKRFAAHQADPETKQMAERGIEALIKRCITKIAEGGWGSVKLELTFVSGEITGFDVDEKASVRTRKKRNTA